jgi:hypothetical protein
MSDYEDEMDVDAPVARDTIMFNSDNTNTKGKRSAANLPVEAEDTLPWLVLFLPQKGRSLTDLQGGKVPSGYFRRCVWSSGYSCHHQ